MKRKFIFFDIDGTLAVGTPGRQYIPESTTLALKKLREAGHFVSIATGRSQAMARKVMEELGFDHMVSDGGYGITIDRKLVHLEPLDYELAVKLIEECRAKDILWAFSPENVPFRLAPDNRFRDITADEYMETRVMENLNPRDYEKIYKVYVAVPSPEEEHLETLRELPWCRFHDTYIFVEPADKSVGIKRIVDHFQGSYSDVVVFGDEKNDLSMFLPEWTSIAMGNAIDALKERATYVTRDAADDGIYHACETYGWFL